ncbi:hypothetical protein CN584_30905 [Bacillus pseudomycoides]|nr:hypothetical protein CON69_28640 [Bacillus pseudomycoides]PEP70759.1 hypothetical protein CN584_30905 [Bacillus pseudomycoides]PGF01651.1 hypothetical protein COM59_31105 [Bacillus pseudomycoides]
MFKIKIIYVTIFIIVKIIFLQIQNIYIYAKNVKFDLSIINQLQSFNKKGKKFTDISLASAIIASEFSITHAAPIYVNKIRSISKLESLREETIKDGIGD